MADGHQKFTLKGGPHNGKVVRLYPDTGRDNSGVKLAPVWFDLNFTDATYTHPDAQDQSVKKPYMLWDEAA